MPKKHSARRRLSREQQRDLDIEIFFIEGLVKRDPKFVEALEILGDDYTQRERFVDGLKVDEQLARLRPLEPLVFYNLACSYALTGRFDAAAGALERALALGYRDFKWIAKDPDLANLRCHPVFKKIRARIRSMRIRIS